MKTEMKNLFIISLFCLLAGGFTGQDLVKNASFEHQGMAPMNYGKINLAEGWYNANGGTVDLYSPSASAQTVGVPVNVQGEQAAFDGNGYAGIIAFQADRVWDVEGSIMNLEKTCKPGYQRYSEYVECDLGQSLIPGKRYKITYQVSLSDKSAYAVSNLGASVSATKIDFRSNEFVDVKPVFVMNKVIEDKDALTEVSGIFTATGGEKYLTIGVFESDDMVNKKVVSDDQFNNKRAYYYIDGLAMLPTEGVDFNNILKGDNVILTNLNFDLGKSTIRSESYEQLNDFATWLKNHSDIVVSIDGHTDKSGDSASNLTLSNARAEAVKDYLLNQGVTSNINTHGYGDTRPLVKGGSEINEKNRRVEISLVK